MKQRFSSLDVRVITHELAASLISLRLANVYDLSTRIFLLKFAKPDHREQLIIDSGFRCHLTNFARATASAPSPFVARLRKLLRTRRVTAVSQIGTDRIIEIQFSDGAYRLYLEFYAGGNIVLTDNDLTILALLRSVNEGAEHEQYKQGLQYNLALRQNFAGVPPLSHERLQNGLRRALEKQQEEAQKPGKKIRKKPGDALRKALAVTTTEFPPVLIDHALHTTGVDRNVQLDDVINKEELLDQVLHALEEARQVVERITSEDVAKGYIVAKRGREDQGAQEESNTTKNVIYEDFHPFQPSQLSEDPSLVFLEHQGFNATVDEFFSSIEGQKLESRLQEREDNAKRKIDQARREQEKRIDGLQQVQEQNIRKAQAIEANVERVEEAIAAVNGLVAQGMDWDDIGHLIENEQSRNNAVANVVKLPLKLHENTITLLLSELALADDDTNMDETDSEPSDSEDEDTKGAATKNARSEDKRLAVDVDLNLSPWSNARLYYDQKRTASVKQEKTVQASQKAIKSTEQKVLADLKKGLKLEKDILRPVRKQMWFEKFIYFISSEGYLVLAGKDGQQNEILYRKYLKKGDVYIHADLHGAASVIVKNLAANSAAPIPPSTLSQAGNLAVCTSSAWDSKAVMSAWWVNADQVSKTAPTGEYLTIGGFMVRGKKNFLPPSQLLLGFGVIFHISEESKARHVKHRLRDDNVSALNSDLTDTSKIAESSAPEEQSDEYISDDDFPDAHIAPTTSHKNDAIDNQGRNRAESSDLSDDEFPDVQHNSTNVALAFHDEENDKRSASYSNPLQPPSQDRSYKDNEKLAEVEDKSDFDHDHNDANDNDDSEKADPDIIPAKSNATLGAEDPAETAEQDLPGTDSQGLPQLSNKERKAAARLEKGNAPPPKAEDVKSKNTKQVRGKKGKAKKIAAKYAHQDEEDRELALKLLGSRATDTTREAGQQDGNAISESAIEARERRRAQHEKTQREGLEAEEIRRLNLDEGVDDLDEDEANTLIQLDAFVGTPLPGDEILAAIPVCAPWTALSKFKYKVKMQPGQQKKGKAMREILGKWGKDGSDPKKIDQGSEDSEKIWPREIDLIRGWKEPEVIGVIPVKSVRVMMSGGTASDKGNKGKAGRGGRGGKKSR